ncbi:MAG: pentapeptide repeat-containing protein [Gammaproteobacteria bacterium]|nr:pentapeptide repeat-containing protein [Gammaproteobacteria bacterium]
MSKKGKGSQRLWYLRQQGEAVKGPYPSGSIRRFLILGRLSLDGEVSTDLDLWQPIHEVPEVVPPDLREALRDGSIDELHPARRREDERVGQDRRTAQERGGPSQGREGERRRPEAIQVQQRRASRLRLQQMANKERGLPTVGIGVGLALVFLSIGFGLYTGPPAPSAESNCVAPPMTGVNWSNCKLEGLRAEYSDLKGAKLLNANLSGSRMSGSRFDGADLRYTDFTAADLSYSEFGAANLKGSSLRNTDLSHANLSFADLSFTDLRAANLGSSMLHGAILDDAIWVDGSTCRSGSVGKCLIAPSNP